MERAKGNMVLLRPERKVMPDQVRPLGNFKEFYICHKKDGKSIRGSRKRDI